MNDNGLIYGLEERPPLKDTLFAALQHLLAIFVAIITPPLIVAGALGLDIQTTSYLVSMSLFVSGIATFVQCMGLGVELYPEILSQFPETVKNIFSSGITTGGLAAIISNMVIRIKGE